MSKQLVFDEDDILGMALALKSALRRKGLVNLKPRSEGRTRRYDVCESSGGCGYTPESAYGGCGYGGCGRSSRSYGGCGLLPCSIGNC